MRLRHYFQRLRIWETNYGRDTGWILELAGKPVAVLSECRSEDMFWDSYRIEPIAEDPSTQQMISSERFWTTSDWARLTWRNRMFDVLPLAPFPAGTPMRQPGRLIVPGLYLPVPPPRTWDRVVLWFRKCRRRRRANCD